MGVVMGLAAGAAALGGAGGVFVSGICCFHLYYSDTKLKISAIAFTVLTALGAGAFGGSLFATSWWIGKAIFLGTTIPPLAVPLMIAGASFVLVAACCLIEGRYGFSSKTS
jgi:hypothetical protein